MYKMPPSRATAALLLSAAMGSAMFGFIKGALWSGVIGVVVAGFTTSAAVGALVALAIEIYPPASRATGVSWCLAMARIGDTLGPLVSV